MARKWQARLINPNREIEVKLNRAINFVLKDLDDWIKSDLVHALIYGGFGIQGLVDTMFYSFITSPEGLSELGIGPSEPPKLLEAYKRTIQVDRQGLQLQVRFGDVAMLKLMTPHPAAGIGNLKIESWLEWILEGVTVGRGYVPRDRLPSRPQASIRLDSPLGGLMLPRGAFGSAGAWRFPQRFANYEVDWLQNNVSQIQQAITTKMVELIGQRINSV